MKNNQVKILLIGKPGIGKTTLIKKITSILSKEAFGGFYTDEIRQKSERVGFMITDFENNSGIMAHINCKNEYRVGKYKVDVEIIDRIGVAAIEKVMQNKRLVIIDEIGKMELFSARFKEAVRKVFNSGISILATIHQHKDPFTDELKKSKGVEVIELTASNRDEVVSQIKRLEFEK